MTYARPFDSGRNAHAKVVKKLHEIHREVAENRIEKVSGTSGRAKKKRGKSAKGVSRRDEVKEEKRKKSFFLVQEENCKEKGGKFTFLFPRFSAFGGRKALQAKNKSLISKSNRFLVPNAKAQ